jgi:hypothetical protein
MSKHWISTMVPPPVAPPPGAAWMAGAALALWTAGRAAMRALRAATQRRPAHPGVVVSKTHA